MVSFLNKVTPLVFAYLPDEIEQKKVHKLVNSTPENILVSIQYFEEKGLITRKWISACKHRLRGARGRGKIIELTDKGKRVQNAIKIIMTI